MTLADIYIYIYIYIYIPRRADIKVTAVFMIITEYEEYESSLNRLRMKIDPLLIVQVVSINCFTAVNINSIEMHFENEM